MVVDRVAGKVVDMGVAEEDTEVADTEEVDTEGSDRDYTMIDPDKVLNKEVEVRRTGDTEEEQVGRTLPSSSHSRRYSATDPPTASVSHRRSFLP